MPAGLHVSTPFFSPPHGTKLSDLVDGGGATPPTLVFEPDGDGSLGTFAFQIKRVGIEYEARVASSTTRTGFPSPSSASPRRRPEILHGRFYFH